MTHFTTLLIVTGKQLAYEHVNKANKLQLGFSQKLRRKYILSVLLHNPFLFLSSLIPEY